MTEPAARRETQRALHPRRGVHAPTRGTPARAPRSLRRTATTDMLRPDGLLGDLTLIGRARDLWTDANGAAHVVGEAGYEATVAFIAGREIRRLRCEPERAGAQRLVGARAAGGFRLLLDGALREERDARSLLFLLLDDLPVAALVSGYALGHGVDISLPKDSDHVRFQSDGCAGWRTGGTMLVELEQKGRIPVSTGPIAPALAREDDPLAWHALPTIPENGMRRHRRLDLALDDGEIRVDALFRDSHVAPGGLETIVHEYTVAARVDFATLTFSQIEATACALPWVECNPAPASAARLAGKPVADLRTLVRRDFTGITTCTHLNDTLRSLEDVESLAPALARLAGAAP